ncbi:uncharacterized protein DS421_2g55380 [Arachis hypogaea]|nr:uncharacterized protein DS421_2g55380 [Arachis hypogaea]
MQLMYKEMIFILICNCYRQYCKCVASFIIYLCEKIPINTGTLSAIFFIISSMRLATI